ncbi:putative exosome complex exonuclease 1 [Trypanosoma vivax]|nr:putative exosome complex exonuclease 1 [Trypanosoma vivax]
MVRRDGRGRCEMRKKEMRISDLSQFDGSSWYSQGLTAVCVAVNGPVAAKQEDYRKCVVSVQVTHASRIPPAGGADRLCVIQKQEQQRREDGEIGQFLTSIVEAIVRLERFPRCVLQVHVTVLFNDGSLLAVATNGLMCALLDAGVPCRTTVAAVCLLACSTDGNDQKNSSTEQVSSTPVLLLDPTLAEEESDEVSSHAIGTFVVANPSSCGGGTNCVLASKVHVRPQSSLGACRLHVNDLNSMVGLAGKAVETLFTFFRNCNTPLE